MTKDKIPVILSVFALILLSILNLNSLIATTSDFESGEWISDGSSLAGWSQMNGDSLFDSSGLYTDDIETDNGKYVAADINAQTGWWDPALVDPARWSGIYSGQIGGLNSLEWEFTLLADLNNTQQIAGAYTYKGYLRMFVFNENGDRMLQVNIRDAAGSSGLTYTNVEYVYYDSEGLGHGLGTDDYNPTIDIDNEQMGMKKNTTGLYWRAPTTWSNPTTGEWVYWGNDSQMLVRGTPSYIAIDAIRQWRRPTRWAFDDISFKYNTSAIPPTIQLVSPMVNGSGIGFDEHILVDVQDNIGIETVEYHWDNEPSNQTAITGEYYNISQLPTEYGVHTLHVYAKDTSNNMKYTRYAFTIGSILSGEIRDALTDTPLVNASVALVNDTTGHILGSELTDIGGNYQFAGLGEASTYGFNITLTGYYPEYVPGITIGVGVHTIQDVSLIESEYPTILSVSHSNGSNIPQNTEIQLEVSDNAGLYQIHHFWDNQIENTSLVVYGNSTYMYIITNLPSALGIHILHAYAEDIGISTAYQRFVFNVTVVPLDTDPPTIGLSGIFEGGTYSGVITVTANIYDESPIFYTGIWLYDQYYNMFNYNTEYNLTLERVSANIWTFTVDFNTTTFANGLASINVEVQDILGNSELVTIEFYIENLPPPPVPEITVFGIENGTTYSGNVLVTATITHNTPLASITCWVRNTTDQYLIWLSKDNLTLINVTSTSWIFSISIETQFLVNGEYTVGVEVEDLIGGYTQQIVEIEILNEAPSSTPPTTTTTTTTHEISPGFTGFSLIGIMIALGFAQSRGIHEKKCK